MQINYQSVIDHFYKEDDALRHILLVHSRQVADKALQIASRHPELQLDTDFLETAAMLHDIGIRECDAPGIQCFGKEPYIRHGVIGGQMLREKGLERHARVCERHTGTGLTAWDIEQQQLQLPHQDFMPETLEEQVVCYADKFYSKSDLSLERSVVQTAQSLEKFGEAGVKKFLKWVELFE